LIDSEYQAINIAFRLNSIIYKNGRSLFNSLS